jgi:hypothetical protein
MMIAARSFWSRASSRCAFPTRPGLVGALCGLAAGVLADSGWRLACEVSSPAHVLESHAFAVLLVTGLGALTAVVIDAV